MTLKDLIPFLSNKNIFAVRSDEWTVIRQKMNLDELSQLAQRSYAVSKIATGEIGYLHQVIITVEEINNDNTKDD